MTIFDSLKKRSRFLVAGFLSFVVALAVFRWSGGQPLVQPASDLGIVIGFALVAGFLVMNDTRASNGNNQS